MAMEYRYLRKAAPTAEDDGTLTGRAWPYGAETQIGSGPYGFREVIRAGAGRKSINDGDIVLLDNHESRLPLARMSAGTLTMADTKNGGDWRAKPADTTYAQDVVKNVRAKNYGGCSFGFEVIRDKWTDDEGNPATPLDGTRREIIEMKVHEISVCTFPAYSQTSVSTKEMVRAARGLSAEDERKLSANAYNGRRDDQGDVADDSDTDAEDAVDMVCQICGFEDTDATFCRNCGQPMVTADGATGRSAAHDGKGKRAAAATYADLSTCGECGASGQYGSFCTNCGKSMSNDTPGGNYCSSCGHELEDNTRACGNCGEEVRGGNAPGDGSKPYGNVTYADPGYQADKKKRYPIDTKAHAKAAWAYISKAKNAAAYTASQLASIKSKIKAALKKFGVTTSPAEAKMAEWEADCDFREMVEGWETMGRKDNFGVLPGDVARAEDVNELAQAIKAAAGQDDRLACITRASEWGLGDMLPDHWGGDGNVATLATEEVTRDMDKIYGLALSLPPTNTALRIMDLAQAYLTQEATEEAQRAKDEPADDLERVLTLADARRAMEEAERRRQALAR